MSHQTSPCEADVGPGAAGRTGRVGVAARHPAGQRHVRAGVARERRPQSRPALVDVVDRLHLLAVLRGALRDRRRRRRWCRRPTARRPGRRSPAICRPELKTYWSAVPFGQKPPPMVDELGRVARRPRRSELRPQVDPVDRHGAQGPGEQPEAALRRAPGSGLADATAGVTAASARASRPASSDDLSYEIVSALRPLSDEMCNRAWPTPHGAPARPPVSAVTLEVELQTETETPRAGREAASAPPARVVDARGRAPLLGRREDVPSPLP